MVEGLIKSIPFYQLTIRKKEIQLAKIREEITKEKMTGGVHSPSIRPAELAMVQSGTKIYKNRIETLIGEESSCLSVIRYCRYQIDKYERFMSVLTEAERDMIVDRYFNDKSMNEIAMKHYVSRETARRWITKALMKYSFEK